MNARDYVGQIEDIDEQIRIIRFDIQQLKESELVITPSYEGERVQASGNNQRMATAIERRADKERELERIMDRLVDKKLEISETIRRMKRPKEKGVLHMVYIQGKNFKEVAQHYDKSVSWATSVHGRALQSLQKELDAREV
jgi:DNA-directed RNA polymerase specialized sigma subunit